VSLASRPAFFLPALIAAILAAVLAWSIFVGEPAPDVQWRIPEFDLTSQTGGAFGSDDLDGRVWIANFFFTSCTTVCPPLMRTMNDIAGRLEDEGLGELRLVSFTVDPRFDTPERLADYGERMGLDTERWAFLTEEPGIMRALLEQGFYVPMGERRNMPGGGFEIAHSGHLLLVDRELGVRGIYGSDREGVEELLEDARRVRSARS